MEEIIQFTPIKDNIKRKSVCDHSAKSYTSCRKFMWASYFVSAVDLQLHSPESVLHQETLHSNGTYLQLMKCNYKKGQLNQFKILVSVINRTVDKRVLCNNAEYSFIVHTSTYDLHFTNSIISNFIFPRNTNPCSLHLHEKIPC